MKICNNYFYSINATFECKLLILTGFVIALISSFHEIPALFGVIGMSMGTSFIVLGMIFSVRRDKKIPVLTYGNVNSWLTYHLRSSKLTHYLYNSWLTRYLYSSWLDGYLYEKVLSLFSDDRIKGQNFYLEFLSIFQKQPKSNIFNGLKLCYLLVTKYSGHSIHPMEGIVECLKNGISEPWGLELYKLMDVSQDAFKKWQSCSKNHPWPLLDYFLDKKILNFKRLADEICSHSQVDMPNMIPYVEELLTIDWKVRHNAISHKKTGDNLSKIINLPGISDFLCALPSILKNDINKNVLEDLICKITECLKNLENNKKACQLILFINEIPNFLRMKIDVQWILQLCLEYQEEIVFNANSAIRLLQNHHKKGTLSLFIEDLKIQVKSHSVD